MERVHLTDDRMVLHQKFQTGCLRLCFWERLKLLDQV